MKAKVYNLKSLESESKELPEQIFGLKKNPVLLARAVRVYLANQRKSRARAKTRADISGSGKKIWRQKGTGRARHGDRYSPIFVGGGAAHGPTGKENWQLSLPKQLRTKALFLALSAKLAEGNLFFVNSFADLGSKTKTAALLFSGLLVKVADLKKDWQDFDLCLVAAKSDADWLRSVANLKNVQVLKADNLNAYEVLNNDFLIIESDSLPVIKKGRSVAKELEVEAGEEKKIKKVARKTVKKTSITKKNG
ncbi:MAG: 50S ribosomal protein L4 [Microgenomates group bacterium ADurb.Bin219]|nr:MAG: 50S ribosomal protein L4 [Microgenomates group bacterium ADurb.Bin219]HNP89221.1 50S ribosomal protein L4 [Candidatus Woesebacteria bacterium]